MGGGCKLPCRLIREKAKGKPAREDHLPFEVRTAVSCSLCQRGRRAAVRRLSATGLS